MEEIEEAPRNDVVTQHPAVERAKRHHVSAARARETLAHSEEIIVISVLARTEAGFDGADLLNLMLACGLRFSEMGIFHRYETKPTIANCSSRWSMSSSRVCSIWIACRRS